VTTKEEYLQRRFTRKYLCEACGTPCMSWLKVVNMDDEEDIFPLCRNCVENLFADMWRKKEENK
jgi:hypothetical protein